MNRIALLLLLGFLSITSSGQEYRYEIPMGKSLKKSQEAFLSSLASEIHYIKLETTPECLLGKDIAGIHFLEGMVYVCDYQYIYKFDKKGKFLKRIGKQGRGPGEYSRNITSYLFDKPNKRFLVYSLIGEKLIHYDLEGKFLHEYRVSRSLSLSNFEWLGKDQFLAYNIGLDRETNTSPNPKDLYILNREGKKLGQLPFKKLKGKKYGMTIYPPIFYKYNQKQYYKNPHESYITEIVDHKKKLPTIFIQLDQFEKDVETTDFLLDRDENNVLTNRRNLKAEAKVSFLDLEETGDYLFITYAHEGQRRYGLFDKKAKNFFQPKTNREEFIGFINDLDGGLPVWPKNGIQKGKMITHIPAYQLLEQLSAEKIQEKGLGSEEARKELCKVIEATNAMDNPIIQVVTLKN